MGPVLLPILMQPFAGQVLGNCCQPGALKKGFEVGVLELQGIWSIGQPSLKTEQSEHGLNPRAHQDDGCFLEY